MKSPLSKNRARIAALLFFFAGTFPASAQVPGFLTPSATSSIPEFIKGFYDFALIVAGVLAVGAIVVGGIMYSVSGAVDKKGLGKEIIAGALWGLLLLLGAYVILRTVNPRLVNLEAPVLPEVGFYQCSEENFKAGKLGNIPVCKYEKGDYWPINFETGECECYVDKVWQEEFVVRIEETANIDGPYNSNGNGPPPSQTGCCVVIDSKITLKHTNINKTDRGVNELLVRLKNVQGVKSWRVTEACPPGHPHQDPCHSQPNCTCVDINFYPKTTSCGEYQKLYNAARSVGFNITNESGCNLEGAPNRKFKYTNGPHLHVELP